MDDKQHQNTDSVEHEPASSIVPLWRVEMEAIDRAVKICNGNITQAAKHLEINPSTIHRKKQSWAKAGLIPQGNHLKED